MIGQSCRLKQYIFRSFFKSLVCLFVCVCALCLLKVCDVQKKCCWSLAVSEDSRFLLTAGCNTLKVWDYNMSLDVNSQVHVIHTYTHTHTSAIHCSLYPKHIPFQVTTSQIVVQLKSYIVQELDTISLYNHNDVCVSVRCLLATLSPSNRWASHLIKWVWCLWVTPSSFGTSWHTLWKRCYGKIPTPTFHPHRNLNSPLGQHLGTLHHVYNHVHCPLRSPAILVSPPKPGSLLWHLGQVQQLKRLAIFSHSSLRILSALN